MEEKDTIENKIEQQLVYAVKLKDLYQISSNNTDLNFTQSLQNGELGDNITMLVRDTSTYNCFRECFTGKLVRLLDEYDSRTLVDQSNPRFVQNLQNVIDTPLFCKNLILVTEENQSQIGNIFLQNKPVENEIRILINEMLKMAYESLSSCMQMTVSNNGFDYMKNVIDGMNSYDLNSIEQDNTDKVL